MYQKLFWWFDNHNSKSFGSLKDFQNNIFQIIISICTAIYSLFYINLLKRIKFRQILIIITDLYYCVDPAKMGVCDWEREKESEFIQSETVLLLPLPTIAVPPFGNIFRYRKGPYGMCPKHPREGTYHI